MFFFFSYRIGKIYRGFRQALAISIVHEAFGSDMAILYEPRHIKAD